MNAAAIISKPVDRLAGWLWRPDTPAPDRKAAQRAQFAAIGTFLLDNELDLTAENLAFALAYVSDADPRLRMAVDALRRTNGGITARDVDRIRATVAPPEPSSDLLQGLTSELEERVGECIGAISESFLSTSEYSKALNVAAADLSSAPSLTYNRLISLTLDVAETTRKISRRLEVAHEDTRRLRADLERARQAAEEDELTGLLNRRGFMARLEAAATADPDRQRSVALCDIDNFKLINDRHGHDVGDRVLRYVARQLRENLDEAIVVARYGGEEFACLFDGMPPAEAAATLDRVRDALSKRALREQASGEAIGSITFSAGIACIDAEVGEALRAADAALYEAKHQGKDRVVTAA